MDIYRSNGCRTTIAALVAVMLLSLLPELRAEVGDAPQIPYVEEGSGWKELDTTLPPFPDPDRFHELPSQLPNTSLKILLVPDSIRVGEDGVIRYIMAIRSPSGARNLFYDGLRCQAKEYKTYAYASSGRKWAEMENPGWQDLNGGGSARYRLFLYRNYFCGLGGERLAQPEMRRRVRYGAPDFNEP